MTKSRKLARLISAMLAMIFSGCVIGWLYCVKPQLLGPAVSGGAISSVYVILYLLWWGLAPATTACIASGPFFLWCVVLLATLLLAVPACWGMWSSRVYLNAAAPAQTQAETTAQLHEKKFLPGFAEDVWETASLDSKTELAKQLAAYELAMLGVPDGTDVTVQPLDEDWLGYYSASSRQIVLSRSVLESGTAQETIDTIAHEAYHAQQAYVVKNIDWDDAATQAAYYDQARRWLRNYQSGYVSGDEDILGYYFQPVEADARAYAKEETERLQELISRNLQEDK